MTTIDLDQLATVTGARSAPVTADTFMPRAYNLQAMNTKFDQSHDPKLGAAIHTEFCSSLYPYAKSGAPINSMFGGIARSKVVDEGDKICK